jgi:hypothetical protein
MFEELYEKVMKVYGIQCCQTENDSCVTCKEFYGDLKWCPKSYADDIIQTINSLEKNVKIIDDIVNKL